MTNLQIGWQTKSSAARFIGTIDFLVQKMHKTRADRRSALLECRKKSFFYCKTDKSIFCIAFSCGRRGTAVAVDEERNDISRQILLQIFYKHLIRQPAAATSAPVSATPTAFAYANRSIPRWGKAFLCTRLGDAYRVCFANRSISRRGRLFLAAIYMH